MRNLADFDVAEVQGLQPPAARRVVLHAQSVVEVLAVEFAVLREQISHAAGDLAADRDSAMPIFHATTLHDDVFSGRVETTPVSVAPGFDRDAVVASIEVTIFNQ